MQTFYFFLSNSTRVIYYAQISPSFNCSTERRVTPPISAGDETTVRKIAIL